MLKEEFNYLEGYDARQLLLAPQFIMADYAITKEKAYRREAGITHELFYAFIHYVMLYIDACMIENKICTRNDVSRELQKINEAFFKLPINNYQELSSDIVTYCLQGSGEGLKYNYSSVEIDETKEIIFNLVKDKAVDVDGKRDYSLVLTKEGVRYLYTTKELSDISPVEIETMVLYKAIDKGHFALARKKVQNIYNQIAAEIRILESDREQLSGNVHQLDSREIVQHNIDGYKMIINQINEIKEVKGLFEMKMNTKKTDNLGFYQKIQVGIADVVFVERQLNLIIDRQAVLIKELQLQNRIIADMAFDTSTFTNRGKVNIMKDILLVWEKEKTGTFGMFNVVRGLFIKKKSLLSLSDLFRPQTIIKERRVKEENIVEIPNECDSKNTDYSTIVKKKKIYEDIFGLILSKAELNVPLKLEALIESPILTQNISELTYILLYLFGLKESKVNFRNTFYSLDEESVEMFDEVYTAIKLGYQLEGLELKIYKLDEKPLVVKKDKTPESVWLEVPNCVFLLKEGEKYESRNL